MLSHQGGPGVLGVASCCWPGASARRLRSITVLFVLNSLAIQVADFGVGFRVLRAAPGSTSPRRAPGVGSGG
ncbi:MAG: hypothetical protein R2690_21240 [Acidimicrobiales bacterium]